MRYISIHILGPRPSRVLVRTPVAQTGPVPVFPSNFVLDFCRKKNRVTIGLRWLFGESAGWCVSKNHVKMEPKSIPKHIKNRCKNRSWKRLGKPSTTIQYICARTLKYWLLSREYACLYKIDRSEKYKNKSTKTWKWPPNRPNINEKSTWISCSKKWCKNCVQWTPLEAQKLRKCRRIKYVCPFSVPK